MTNALTITALGWAELKGYVIGTWFGVIAILTVIVMVLCKVEVEEE